jgi:hypothetical protein
MNPGIFLIQENGEFVKMNETPYDHPEAVLQTWLEKCPSLLAGHQINPSAPRKWLFIERESGVPSEKGGSDRWSADHLFLDQDAIPTIVEVKRSSDTRIRREVVGQMLDYAANAVVYWPVDRIRLSFEARCVNEGLDPDQRLKDSFDLNVEPNEFWRKANVNLQAGNVRLLFVADEIPPELQAIVEFLNRQMNPAQVFAVEIKQFVGEGLRALVPRVIGSLPPPPPEPTPTVEEFLAAMSPVDADLAQRILEWPGISGVRPGKSYLTPEFGYRSDKYTPISIGRNGRLYLAFEALRGNRPFDLEEKRLELRRRVNGIAGVKLNDKEWGPSTELSALANDNALEEFKGVIAWAVKEIESAQQPESSNPLPRST